MFKLNFLLNKFIPVVAGVLFFSGCMQTENSSALDRDVYGGGDLSPEFVAARAVIQQNCANCHSYHALSEEDLLGPICGGEGCIVAGQPEASPLYYRLSGSAGDQGPKDMPLGGSLTEAQVQVIEDWILSVVE